MFRIVCFMLLMRYIRTKDFYECHFENFLSQFKEYDAVKCQQNKYKINTAFIFSKLLPFSLHKSLVINYFVMTLNSSLFLSSKMKLKSLKITSSVTVTCTVVLNNMHIIISFMDLWGTYMSKIRKPHKRSNFQNNINNLQKLVIEMKGLCWDQMSAT
jgi:hypothetical protein